MSQASRTAANLPASRSPTRSPAELQSARPAWGRAGAGPEARLGNRALHALATSGGDAPFIQAMCRSPSCPGLMAMVQRHAVQRQAMDRHELEADRTADLVMGAGPQASPTISPVSRALTPAPAATAAADGASVQSKAGGETSTGDVASAPSLPRSAGQPLPSRQRAFLEPRFGRDLGTVRIHTGAEADFSARSFGARAYTHANNVVFRSGEYSPSSESGGWLLAHELTHVAQQGHAPALGAGALSAIPAPSGIRQHKGEMVETAKRNDGPGTTDNVAGVSMSVSLDGLTFSVPETITYKKGPRTPQLLEIALKRLLGPEYKPALKLEDRIAQELGRAKLKRSGGFKMAGIAKAGEEIGLIRFDLKATIIILDTIKSLNIPTTLSEEQINLLQLGAASGFLWQDFVEIVRGTGEELPKWYDFDLFQSDMASRGALLKRYLEAMKTSGKDDAGAYQKRTETVNDVVSALLTPILVMEAVRQDTALAGSQDTAGGYVALWRTPKDWKIGQPLPTPRRINNKAAAALFLNYQQSQQKLAQSAEFNGEDRKTLMRNFGFFLDRTSFAGSLQGDQQIRDTPATANAPAFPSSLTPVPAIPPPIYNAALGTDHRFEMVVEYPSVYEALGNYVFNWEMVRIPDDTIGAPVDVEALPRDEISNGSVAYVRFSRDVAYAAADIERSINDMRTELGPAGVGALQLIGANAILRFIGTGLKLAIDLLTMPRSQKLVTFPKPGLYMVRAAMAQAKDDNASVIRAPSVAYYPVLAASAEDMARSGVSKELSRKEKSKKRIEEIEKKLKEDISEDERKALKEELDALKLSLGSLGDRLAAQRSKAGEYEASVKAKLESSDPEGTTAADLDAAEAQREKLDKIIALRAKRDVEGAEPIPATFVSDLGQTIPLNFEVVDKEASKGSFKVYLSDVTTPKSGDGTATGRTREDAIANAAKELLESVHGYGRGQLAIAMRGGVRSIRIEAGEGALLMEAVENVSTALSVAAIVAAPLTGGASLTFLIPLGLVGGIPSAYRIAKRLEAGTFTMDLENALELVNVASSLVGVGRVAGGTLKSVRLGRGLLVVGFGLDAASGILMGAQVMLQIDEISKLPPGQRASAMALLIGTQLVQAGVMVGGALMEKAAQAHTDAKIMAGEKNLPGEGMVGSSRDAPPAREIDPATSGAPRHEPPHMDGPGGGTDTVLATEPVGEGHHIEVKERGIELCSPKPCPLLNVEYAKEMETYPGFQTRFDEIQGMRKTKPQEAAKKAANLERDLKSLREAAAKVGSADELKLGGPEHEGLSFELDVSERKKRQLKSGERDFQLSHEVTFDIDEPLPVGAKEISRGEKIRRALDPHNRQLLDPMTNRRTKHLRVSDKPASEPLKAVSVKDNPDAIIGRRFDEVTEMRQVFDQAVAKIKDPNSMSPTALKETINGHFRDIVQEGRTPEGVAIRDALKSIGFECVAGKGLVAVTKE